MTGKKQRKIGFYGFVATSPSWKNCWEEKKLLGRLGCHCVTPPLLSPGVVRPLAPPPLTSTTYCTAFTLHVIMWNLVDRLIVLLRESKVNSMSLEQTIQQLKPLTGYKFRVVAWNFHGASQQDVCIDLVTAPEESEGLCCYYCCPCRSAWPESVHLFVCLFVCSITQK